MKQQRLVGLFALGVLLLHFPVLAVFDGAGSVGGVPALVAYLFAVWGGLIAAAGWLARQPDGSPPPEP